MITLEKIYADLRSRVTPEMLRSPDGKNPLVSIIVTAHNTEQYLESCIESLLNQTYPNKEIIVVDDFSSDHTAAIGRRLERAYREVKYYRLNCNLGTYYAKNLGLQVCHGQYVFFQDSDDISHPIRISLLLAQLRANKKRVVRGSYCRIDPETDQVIEVNGLASKLGLITLGVERKVFEEIGYFNCTTKASDDEFYNRIVKFLGKNAVVNNELPLYYNTYRDGSLFADMVTRTAGGGIQQQPSESRAHYVEGFRRIHEQNDIQSIRSIFSFPRVRDAVDVRTDMTKLPNPADRIVYSVCSIPKREASFKKCVASIIDQCDELHVYLDRYAYIPDFLKHLGAKCRVVTSDQRPGLRDNGKFLLLEENRRLAKNAYYFTIDDDIVYPADYTNSMIARLQSYGNRCAVGVHGVLLKDHPAGYFSDRRIVYNFIKGLESDRAVNLIGTGTLAFHTSVFSRFDLSEFACPGMADIFFALKCKRENIPMVAISRCDGWLVEMNPEPQASLYHEFKNADSHQAEAVRNAAPWGLAQIIGCVEALARTDPGAAKDLQKTIPPLRSLTR
jgi:glycosyltransferase involved in cell wall biosynthesis